MARVTNYVADGTFVGQQFEVKAKKFVWVKVGQGAVSKLSEHEVAIAGKISILGYSGDLNIHMQLTDQDITSAKGPCILQLNTHIDENARYEAAHDSLTIFATLGGKEQNIAVLQCNNGEQTECKLFGHVNQTVHLDPSS
ncbi:MAG: hypothetical protein R3293_19780 [Candidatus Promineifilaceae bacterium]|nr:hypothetical protein [Candidatus Promineifilaceae bacterium]